VKLIETMATV